MTKKAHLIVYTRNSEIDYRMVVTPGEDFCPPETRKYFRKLIRGSIDVETFDDPLTQPRWLYVRKDDMVLFGVATMLKELDAECYTDVKDRPVRGFYGIAIDASEGEVEIPYNLNFFKDINAKYIQPFWNAGKDEFIRKDVVIDLAEYDVELLPASNSKVTLNTHTDECVVLGDVNMADALRAALYIGKNLSLVSGFNSKLHAFAQGAEYDYMNAIVEGVHEREIHKVEEKTKPIHQDTSNADIPSYPQQPKKASRPKTRMALLVIIAALTVIILARVCGHDRKIHNTSTSGDQENVNPTDSIKSRTDSIGN